MEKDDAHETRTGPRKQSHRLKSRPAHGQDYEIENFSVEEIKARRVYEHAKTRNRISLLTMSAAIAAMLIAFVYGLVVGNLSSVGYTWAVVGPISAAVFGYYFRHDPKDFG